MADVRKRIADLLRLAAPNNGATEAERTNAALEAAAMIARHGYVVEEAPPPVERRRRPPPPPPVYREPEYEPPSPPPRRSAPWTPPPDPYSRYYPSVSGSDWRESVAGSRTSCIACGRGIAPGDTAFHDVMRGWRCYDITCTESRR